MAGSARWRAVARRDGPLVALLAVFLVARVLVWRGGKIYTSFDTFTYARRGDPSFDGRGPLVSLTGDAPRLWGTPVFDALFGSDTARAFGQWSLSTVAWALLAWALWGALRSLPARLLASGGVLLLAVLRPVTNWDFAILSESLSISLGVLTAALLLRWWTHRSRIALVAALMAAVWWTFVRPDIIVYTGLLAALLGWVAWRDRERRKSAIAGVAVLALALGWCLAITPRVKESYQPFSATPEIGYDQSLSTYQLRLLVLPRPAVTEQYRSEGMPSCPEAERIAAGRDWATIEFVAAYVDCPELAAWWDEHGGGVLPHLATTRPGEALKLTWDLLTLVFNGAKYASVPPVVPTVVEKAIYPPWRTPVFVPVAFVLALALALAAGAWRRRRLLFWYAAFIGGASLVSALGAIVAGGSEFNRLGVQESTGLRIAVAVLFAVAVDLAVERVRRNRSNTGPEPADVMEYPHTPEDPPAEAVAARTAADTQTREG